MAGPVFDGMSPQRTTRRRKRPPLAGQIGGQLGSPIRPFTPYEAPPTPAGYYDPALDAARGAASRGLGDLQGDTALADSRATADYGLGLNNIQLGQDRGNQDIDSRQLALGRSYDSLQRRQSQTINAAGLGAGGAALQAAAKRAANRQIDQVPLSTARTRLAEDSDLARGDLTLGYERGNDDRGRTLTRAEREDAQFGVDTETQKGFQATQAGYIAPGRPDNEFINKRGGVRRTVESGGSRFVVRPDGTVTKRLGGAGAFGGVVGGQIAAPGLGGSVGQELVKRRRRRG